jgi:hypothetical protein
MYAKEDEIDIQDGTGELLKAVNKLQLESEQLNKSLREKEHNYSQNIQALSIENENLSSTLKTVQNLLASYKYQQGGGDKQIESLEIQVSELENKLFQSEQNEMNLKRVNQTLQIDISNLNIEIDRLKIRKNENTNVFRRQNTHESLDEEAKKLLTELMNEIDELKKDNNEISEKALNLLTEKELLIMELREELSDIKTLNKAEINRLMGIINDLKLQLDENEYGSDKVSDNSEDGDAYKDLQNLYEKLGIQFQEKQNEWQFETTNLLKRFGLNEEVYKNTITELEIELSKLKAEVTIGEVNRYKLEKELYGSDKIHEIEVLRGQMRQVEELKEKSDQRYKEHMSTCQSETKELETTNRQLRELKAENEKEIKNLKSQLHKLDSEIREKQVGIKEKEIIQLKEKLEQSEKDRESIEKDYEIMKRNNEKNRNEYKELCEDLRRIKDYNENETHKWEEKFFNLVKTYETERLQLLENNKELVNMLHQRSYSKTSTCSESMNTLSNILDKEDDEEVDKIKISLLESENTNLNQKLIEYTTKLNNRQKLISELEYTKKENSKLKEDLKEVKKLYEKQIETIQQKALQTSAELQCTRKRATTIRNASNVGLFTSKVHMLGEIQSTMNKLVAENKYLTESIEIVHKQVENIKMLKNNDINFLKEEIRIIEEQYVLVKLELGSQAFEKESEIIKLKKYAKKYKQKYLTLLEKASKS